jgi:hypothetical protein
VWCSDRSFEKDLAPRARRARTHDRERREELGLLGRCVEKDVVAAE